MVALALCERVIALAALYAIEEKSTGRMEFMPTTTRNNLITRTRDVEGGMQRGYALVRSAREKRQAGKL